MKKMILTVPVLFLLALASCSGKADAESRPEPEETSDSKAKVTFIELGSVNCVPCKAMVPIMKQMEEELGDQVEVLFYDVWKAEGRPYGKKYGIQVIPTQIFLDRNGKEYYRHEGYFPLEEIYPILVQGGVKLQ